MTRRFLQISLAVLFLAPASFAATTITWWQFWTDPGVRPIIKAMVDEFEQANPDIKVELTDLTWANGHEKIVIAYSSGTAPDVVELGSDWIAQFAANGQLADLSKSSTADSSEYHGWSLATYGNRIFARPWFLGTRVLFANRDLLVEAGYDKDFMPYRWSDLKEAARKIRGLGKDIYGWGSNAPEKHRLYKKFLPFMWSAGGQIFSDDGRLCVLPSIHTVLALKTYKELHDSSGYVADQRGIEDAFLDGKVGFIISGDWLLKRIELEKRSINLATALMPGPNFPGKSFLGGEFLALSESSPHKEEAMRFMAFITSPENQVRFCKANRSATPSSKAAQQDPYFSSTEPLRIFNKQILSVKHPPVDPDWVEIEDIIEKAVEDALFGSGMIAEPLRQAQIKIEQLKSK